MDALSVLFLIIVVGIVIAAWAIADTGLAYLAGHAVGERVLRWMGLKPDWSPKTRLARVVLWSLFAAGFVMGILVIMSR